MDTKAKRDDFPSEVKEALKQRAAYICSNPTCRKMTIAPSVEDENKVQYIGICAHITAAIKGGPRYDENISSEDRASMSNGIFLCSNCATQIDKNNGIDFTTTQLKEWKTNHNKWVLENLNKSQPDKIVSSSVSSNNQHGGIVANVVNFHNSTTEKSIENNSSINEHDRKIFVQAEEIMDEDTLRYILSRLQSDESIVTDNTDKIETLKFFYTKTSNQYINENIESAKKIFSAALEDLNDFLLSDFDMWPYDQKMDNFRICMNPLVNIDRGGSLTPENNEEHRRLKKILYETTKKLQNSYDNLRRAIKITLHI